MIERSDEEIKSKCREIWDDGDFDIVRNGDTVSITAKRMYEYIEYALPQLMTLADFFGTKNINDSRYSYGGCETCDYGSSYEVTFDIKPESV